MTVTELRKYIFSGAQVKLVRDHMTVYEGYANTLPNCGFGNYIVKDDGICTLNNDNVIRIIISSPSPNEIPNEFDSYEVPQKVSDRFIKERIPSHVTVLGSYVHSMTKETRYSIRIEHMGLFGNEAQEEYQVVSEDILRDLYERGKKK